MAVKLYSSRLFIRDACRRIDENGTHIAEMSAMAKLYASDECFNVNFYRRQNIDLGG